MLNDVFALNRMAHGGESRVKFLRASPELLLSLLKVNDTEVDGRIFSFASDPIPADARVVDCFVSDETHCVTFRIESDDFPVVKSGEEIAELRPMYQSRTKEA